MARIGGRKPVVKLIRAIIAVVPTIVHIVNGQFLIHTTVLAHDGG